jgi:hypothetical protein
VRAPLVLLAAPVLLAPSLVLAHDGPPYPIIVDRPLGSLLFSVWTDPDVGEGTFYLIFTTAPGTSMEGTIDAAISVEPADGHAAPARHLTQPMKSSGDARRLALVPFDREGVWRARFEVATPAGVHVVESEVEVTPPGGGPSALLLYLMPFVLVGFLWIKALLRRRG